MTPKVIEIWPGLAPGEQTRNPGTSETEGGILRLRDVSQPQLLLFPANGSGAHPAVMVCPGGGYSLLATDLEGTEVARWLNGLGFTAAVLHYRVPDKRKAAYADGQRALALLRSRAKELGIDPHRLGVLGFSAGGHLSARLAAGEGSQAASRPDFAVLVYPAYLLDAQGLPAPEVKPHAGMPPIFLTQTQDDPYLCAPAYATALQDAQVPVRGVYYAQGGHGYGLRLPAEKPAHAWADEAARWLKEQTHR